MYPFPEGSQFIVYDSATHTATLENDRALAHPASYANASRVTTYLRGGVEQLHGAIKQTYQVLGYMFVWWLPLNSHCFRFLTACRLLSSNLWGQASLKPSPISTNLTGVKNGLGTLSPTLSMCAFCHITTMATRSSDGQLLQSFRYHLIYNL